MNSDTRLIQWPLSIFIVLLFLLTSRSLYADALLVHAGVAIRANDVKAKIDGTGLYGGTTILFNALAATPDLATLGQHDAVLVWSDGPFADADTLGDNLADYVDQGGTVVTMVFSLVSGSGFEIGGRWRDEGYSPILTGSSNFVNQLTLGLIHESNDGLIQNVDTFAAGSRTFRSAGSLAPGAALIAEWSDGAPLVAAFDSFVGCVVALNFYPPSSDTDSDFWDAGTDGDILMANALNYVCCIGHNANDPDGDNDGIPDACDPPTVHNITQGTDHFTLQDAIDDAANGDVIEADPQTYFESISFLGKAITLRSSSGDPNDTIIDGTGHLRVVQCISGEDPNTILEGFTITGGNATENFPNDRGGGMYNDNSSPTVNHCVFANNQARSGGGMYNLNSSPIVSHCVFSGNIATSRAGGMYNEESSPQITHCIFQANTSNFNGGGMYNEESSPQVTHCVFEDNRTDFSGGGMYSIRSSSTIRHCTFVNNFSKNRGGGVYNVGGSSRVSHSVFTSNTAGSSSGGLGGGLSNNGGSLVVNDCLFVGNISQRNGGAIELSIDNSAEITNSTFVDNTADDFGGGINVRIDLTLTMTNNILWNNRDNGGMDASAQIHLNSGTVTVNYSDVMGGWDGAGVGNINADPLFVDPDGADNDSNTREDNDYRLLAGSPCIDAGDSTALPAGILTDLDGNPRIQNNPFAEDTGVGIPTVDMGAYEFDVTHLNCPLMPIGDVNCDGVVNFLDFGITASNWLAAL